MNNGIEYKTRYRTEDEGPMSFSAGKLDERGIVFYLKELNTHESAYQDKQTGEIKPFYTAEGFDQNGCQVSLAFSSKRLKRVLDKVLAVIEEDDEMANKLVRISGRGSGFDRNYDVQLIDPEEL